MFFVSDLARSASGRFVVHSSALARHWDNNRFRRLLTPTRSAPDGQAHEKWNIERFKQCETGDRFGGQLVARRFRWIPIPRKPTWRAHRTFRQAAVIQVTWEARAIEPDRRTLRQGREIGANEAIPASNPASNPLGSRAQSSLPRGKPAFTKVTWITFPVLNQSYVRSIKTSCTPACRR